MTTTRVIFDTNCWFDIMVETRPRHLIANQSYRFIVEQFPRTQLLLSTIVLAEFSFGAKFPDEYFRNCLPLPFTVEHARLFRNLRELFVAENAKKANTQSPRTCLKDDLKLIAQAHAAQAVIVSSDERLIRIGQEAQHLLSWNCRVLDLSQPVDEARLFGTPGDLFASAAP